MLTDTLHRPLRDLRISVTDRCNFRCTYCMPKEKGPYHFLPKEELLNFEEIQRLSKIFVKLGVNKLRLTGGEPLVRREIDTLVAKLAGVAGLVDLTLTTNGVLLPEYAQKLKAAGLQRLTVSLDSLEETIFRRMGGVNFGPEKVLRGIEAAEQAGFRPLKINVVVQRGVNENSLLALAEYGRSRQHIVRFIEYMDVGTLNRWQLSQVVPAKEIFTMIHQQWPLEPIAHNYRGEVATRYRYQDSKGEIGIIASVTQPFCGDCTRLRLSPRGILYTCLFANQGFDVLSPLRAGANDLELELMLRKLWQARTDRYSEQRAALEKQSAARPQKVEMYHIGG